MLFSLNLAFFNLKGNFNKLEPTLTNFSQPSFFDFFLPFLGSSLTDQIKKALQSQKLTL